ncbi:MAG: M12 family metallo-peptidase [Gammaproteobacteria bacterium]|jgi:hypothetical protein|nr:M12 family metallo-peptidase [Gammaproteobacteria bacterium]
MFKIKLLMLTVMLLLAARAGAAEQIWQEVSERQARSVDNYQRQYQVDSLALRATLQRVTREIGPGSVRIIRLPMPDGSLADFEIYESPIMQDELAQRYPEIKTYKVYGIDDPLASGRLDITPQGFHALLHTSQGRLFIDPDAGSPLADRYRARTRNAAPTSGYSCGVDEPEYAMRAPQQSAARTAARASDTFLQYRLAVAATEEYVLRVTGSRFDFLGAQARIVTAINRVNQIYERDLSIRLVLVANNDQLIENNGNVSFSNGNPPQMFAENQAWIDSRLGPSGYDIGHIFGTGGGGLALLGSVCASNNKAKGVSGIVDPLGDPFYIDFVAHEIGHQFNADHSFNGLEGSCGTGRNQATAYEPGSGSTIMAYAGICDVEDLQSNSDATFHAASIAQINSFTAAGGSCFSEVPGFIDNLNDPVVAAVADRTIPANTAFVLDASASDADGNTLSYQWDQLDAGCPTNASSFGTDTGFNGLFRSYPPRVVAKRHFPALGTQLQGLFDDAEVIPCNNRDVNLRFTARDGLSGQDSDDVKVTVRDTGAVFEITNLDSPLSPIDTRTPITVNWRVAATDQAPINCSSVKIELLTIADDGSSYSVHPLLTTANTGSADVSITPVGSSHPRARIRVQCGNNIFYDISDVDFAVDGSASGAGTFSDSDNELFYNNNGTTGLAAPACGAVVECKVSEIGGPGIDPPANGDSSALDYRWLLLLTGLLVLAHARRARRT